MQNLKLLKKPILIIFLVLLLDQIVKVWIKTHMTIGQEYHVFGNWFIIHFTENNGMAYGIQFGENIGKLLLSLFRIVAVGFLIWYIIHLSKKNTPQGIIVCFSLITAGALGNIIDSAFYGILFSESTFYDVARFLPPEGGYSTFLHGKVVDMLYFPLIKNSAGETLFFSPVFNIADSAITIGVLVLLVFYHKFLNSKKQDEKEPLAEDINK